MKTLAVLLALFASSSALAQNGPPMPRCGPHDQQLKIVLEGYREAPVFRGISIGPGGVTDGVIEVTANDEGGWTLFHTGPTGKTCVITSGGEGKVLAPATPPGSIKPSKWAV